MHMQAINIDIYEYYYKVINWMPYSEKNAKGSGAWYYRYSVALTYCSDLKKHIVMHKKVYKKKLIIHGVG